MKGLRKVLTPFAPDQSGAVSVLYALDGMIVVLDAGGCTGNICGFDEPRWQHEKSAIFSAGLRDMDAVFGRDKELVEKVKIAADQMDAAFIVLVGTPVPAVIGTDYHGLKRMLEKEVNLPVLAIETNGMALYDCGIEAAWLALVKTFCKNSGQPKRGVGIIGVSPMDFPDNKLRNVPEITSVNSIAALANTERNIVVSPAGRKAADYLKKTFGVPYTCTVPDELLTNIDLPADDKNILIIHQQYIANALRKKMSKAKNVTVASWFMADKKQWQLGDVKLKEEDDFTSLIAAHHYDVIMTDAVLKPLLPENFKGAWVDLPHFALSGRKAV